MRFRRASLPADVKGSLYLHKMLGRNENLSESFQEIRIQSINWILSLAPMEEIRAKSPSYAQAIQLGKLPCEFTAFPITDYGVPERQSDFASLVKDIAERLRNGERIVIHCGAGIGRTGTMACCILAELGHSEDEARNAIKAAGSGPETDEQNDLIHWYVETITPQKN